VRALSHVFFFSTLVRCGEYRSQTGIQRKLNFVSVRTIKDRSSVGQGGKATSVTATDTDILREIVCLLTQRVRAGRATFLIKLKSHRGETINERKGSTTVLSVWTNSVRNAFRKQAGWAKLQEAIATAAKHWTERVWYCHNQCWLQASRAGTEASQSGSFKDEHDWGKKCFEDLEQRRMGRPVTRTWSTDFLLREGSSREEMEKWLENKSIPWPRRKRLLQVVTGTFPCGQQMLKYGYRRAAECTLCKKVHEESESSWNRELPKATIGHIQSAECLGQKEVVTAALQLRASGRCYRKSMCMGKHMKLLTIETESRLGTLWDQEQCRQCCSHCVYIQSAGCLGQKEV
jgi:hypothetical protein